MTGVLFKGDIYIGTGSYCYDEDPVNCEKYEQLYDYPSAQKACPKGWRLPTKKEWKALNDKYKNCDPSIDGGIRKELPLYEPLGGGKGHARYRYHKDPRDTRKILSFFPADQIAEYWCAADESIPHLKVMIELTIKIERCAVSFGAHKPKEYLASKNFISCRCVKEAK